MSESSEQPRRALNNTRRSPHLSDMLGYLVRITNPTFRFQEWPAGLAEREVMVCDLAVLDPPVTLGPRHMAVRYRKTWRPEDLGEAVLPATFPGAIVGAWGLISFVRRMVPHATSGRIVRYEPMRRPDGPQHRHAGRTYTINPPTDDDLEIIARYLNGQP